MPVDRPVVLVVEDEPAQREVLRYNLGAQGYTVETVADGEEALLRTVEIVPDVIVLDWMLPLVSGIEVCRRLKARASTKEIPIVMLSARTEEDEKVRGLETGADDYVVKPYQVSELMARIRTQLRRVRPASVGVRLEFGDIVLDTEAHRATRAGKPLKLAPNDFRVLSVFMEKPGKVWSREQLLDRIWGHDALLDTRTVDVQIGRLRKALTRDGGDDPIRTVRSAGYAIG